MSSAEYCKYNQNVYIEMRELTLLIHRHSPRNNDICKLETVKFDDFNVLVFFWNKQCSFD